MRRFIVALLFLPAACASDEAIQEDWADYVAQHDSCTVAADCAVIYPGCPLGCWTAVSSADQADAEAEAQRLIDRYERGGKACSYGCVESGEVMCEAGHCVLGPASEPDETDPCADKVCGDTCTTCTGNACPAVEEYCGADGVCSSEAPTACDG